MKKILFFLLFAALTASPAAGAASGTASPGGVGYYTEYPFENAALTDAEIGEILPLLKSCADIMDYDCLDFDIHRLTKYVLYTKDNFKLICGEPSAEGEGEPLSYCDGGYIDNIMYTAFRLAPDRPSADKLLEYSYYYSGGLYYYTGGFDSFFATDVRGITDAYRLNGSALYVVFENTYYSGGGNVLEYSSAVIDRDADGYYIKRLNMNSEPLSYAELRNYAGKSFSDTIAGLKKYIPLGIMAAAAAAVVFVIFKYFV